MYIRGLIPWNFAELAEAVPIDDTKGIIYLAFDISTIKIHAKVLHILGVFKNIQTLVGQLQYIHSSHLHIFFTKIIAWKKFKRRNVKWLGYLCYDTALIIQYARFIYNIQHAYQTL